MLPLLSHLRYQLLLSSTCCDLHSSLRDETITIICNLLTLLYTSQYLRIKKEVISLEDMELVEVKILYL